LCGALRRAGMDQSIIVTSPATGLREAPRRTQPLPLFGSQAQSQRTRSAVLSRPSPLEHTSTFVPDQKTVRCGGDAPLVPVLTPVGSRGAPLRCIPWKQVTRTSYGALAVPRRSYRRSQLTHVRCTAPNPAWARPGKRPPPVAPRAQAPHRPRPATPRACAQRSLSTTYGLWRRCPRRRPHRPLTSTCGGDWQGPIPVGTSQCLEGACVQSPAARCASSARTRGQQDPAPDLLDMERPDGPGRAAGPSGTAPARRTGGRYKRPCGGALPHALKPSPPRVWTGCPPRTRGQPAYGQFTTCRERCRVAYRPHGSPCGYRAGQRSTGSPPHVVCRRGGTQGPAQAGPAYLIDYFYTTE
jgi:hypothetical protein